jgi:hypothetical protein
MLHSTDQFSVLMNEVMDYVNECVDGLIGHVEGLSCFSKKIKDIKLNIFNEFPVTRSQKRRVDMIEELAGSPARIFFGFGVNGLRHMVSGVKLFGVLKMGDPLFEIADAVYVA